MNKAVNKGGQFAPPERRKFGAGKSMTLKDLRRCDAPSIAALNCPRRHAAREKVPLVSMTARLIQLQRQELRLCSEQTNRKCSCCKSFPVMLLLS